MILSDLIACCQCKRTVAVEGTKKGDGGGKNKRPKKFERGENEESNSGVAKN